MNEVLSVMKCCERPTDKHTARSEDDSNPEGERTERNFFPNSVFTLGTERRNWSWDRRLSLVLVLWVMCDCENGVTV